MVNCKRNRKNYKCSYTFFHYKNIFFVSFHNFSTLVSKLNEGIKLSRCVVLSEFQLHLFYYSTR